MELVVVQRRSNDPLLAPALCASPAFWPKVLIWTDLPTGGVPLVWTPGSVTGWTSRAVAIRNKYHPAMSTGIILLQP